MLKFVNSSAIRAVDYDRKRRILRVWFHHGGDYTYGGVGYHRYRRLVTAPSVGKYFNEAIRPRKEKSSGMVNRDDSHRPGAD